MPLRLVMIGAVAAVLVTSAAIAYPLSDRGASALAQQEYVGDVSEAVTSLTLVFGQADESVKLVQNGWLAPEGAASQFGFLHEQVKTIKSDISKAEPPADMQPFHRQLGRSVSLTQQAMDAMQTGFSTGDATYFALAGSKLSEARTTLNRAVNEL